MAERTPPMAPADLEVALVALGRALPPAPVDLADRVLARVSTSDASASASTRDGAERPDGDVLGVRPPAAPRLRGRRRLAALVAAALATVLAVLGPGRVAVARWRAEPIDVRRVAAVVVDRARPDLPGEGTTDLAAAQEAVDFDVRLPAGLAGPLVARPGVPPGGITLAWPTEGVVITEHPGAVSTVVKQVGPTGEVEAVTVDGHQGWWLTGPDHAVLFTDAEGRELRTDGRRVVDTLAWVDERGVVIRIEAERPLAEVLALAATLR